MLLRISKDEVERRLLKLKLNETLKRLRRRFRVEEITLLRIAVVLGMLIKTFLFMAIIETNNVDKVDFNKINYIFTLSYLSFILLVYSFGYLFKRKYQVIYYITISFIYSLLLVIDVSYFKINRDLIGIKNILFPGTFNPTGKSIEIFRPLYLIFFIDVIMITVFMITKKIKNTAERSFASFFCSIKWAVVFILISYVMFDGLSLAGWDKALFYKEWTTLMSVRAPGPLGYHLIEAVKTVDKSINKITEKEKTEVESWLADNKENLPDNKYSGIFKGKNVIFIQCESLESFIINKKTNGQEITPFINSLANNGLYFNNFFEQNNGGNSIDCDLMVNTSIYPIGDVITATNYGENVYPNSLPRILERAGYRTITAHAVLPGDFNGTELHKNGLGVQTYYHENDFVYDEAVGYGLSDRSMFSQLVDKLKNEKQPFFVQAPTLSTHGPFDLKEKYRKLNLPKDIDESYLGGYFESFHYFDEQVKLLFEKLESNGLLDNTVVVLYGDHAGVHKYYNDDIKDLNYEDGWWQGYDHRIPMIIYSKGIKPDTISTYGGQIDILPTIAYMLGINKEEYINTAMGKILVNTNKDATVLKNNEIVGNVKNEEEKQHLLSAYRIGDIILRNNYFHNISK